MSEIILDEKKFETQIQTFEKYINTINNLKYSANPEDMRLESVDKFIESLNEFNNVINLLTTLLNNDAQSMKKVISTWKGLDADLSNAW